MENIEEFLSMQNAELWDFTNDCECEEYIKIQNPIDKYITYKTLSIDEKKKTEYKEAQELVIITKRQIKGVSDPDTGSNLLQKIYKTLWKDIVEKNYMTYKGKIQADTMTSVTNSLNQYFENKVESKEEKIARGKNNLSKYYITELYARNPQEFIERLEKNENLKRFIAIYHTIGNFIPTPHLFNSARSGIGAKHDYWDLTLTKIHEWYISDNLEDKDETLKLLLHTEDINSEVVRNCRNWLKDYGNGKEGFEKFIKDNYLENFVENGIPKMFCNHTWEKPEIPENEFDEFFENVNKLIVERGIKIIKKLGENVENMDYESNISSENDEKIIPNLRKLEGKELTNELIKVLEIMQENDRKEEEYNQKLSKIKDSRAAKNVEKDDLEDKLIKSKPETMKQYERKENKKIKRIALAIFVIGTILMSFGTVAYFYFTRAGAEADTKDIIGLVVAFVGSALTSILGIGLFYKCFTDFFEFDGMIGRIIKSLAIASITMLVTLIIIAKIIGTDNFIPITMPIMLIGAGVIGIVSKIIHKIMSIAVNKGQYAQYLKEKSKFDIQAEEEWKKRKENIKEQIEKIEKDIPELNKKIEELENNKPKTVNLYPKLKDYIGIDYMNSRAFIKFIEYIEQGKCDTLKECINKYDLELEKRANEAKFENLNKQIRENEEELKKNKEELEDAQKQVEKTNERMQKFQEETAEKFKATDDKFKETNETVNKVGKRLSWTDEQRYDIDRMTKDKK